MKNIGKKIRYGFTELPKVSLLLLVGALIMFPMYMMIAISLMTPAQLEKCPWFPLSIPMPESLKAPRAGELALAPPSLEVQPEGGPRIAASVPTDRRFYVHLPDVDMDTAEWAVDPKRGAGGAAEPAVVAEYRASNVWEVGQDGAGAYRVDNRPFTVPQGFTPILPGLQLKAQALELLQAVDKASRAAAESLKIASSAERIAEPGPQAQRRREAVLKWIEAGLYLEQSETALTEAARLAQRAEAFHVTFADSAGEFRQKNERTRVNYDRAAEKMAGYVRDYAQAARARAAETTRAAPRDPRIFKVDRGEPVALLLLDRPARVSRRFGVMTVETAWSYELNSKELFRIRPLVAKTDPQGREVVPGEPLAEAYATRDVEAGWDGTRWLVGEDPLASYLPPGFVLTLADGPGGQAGAKQAIKPRQIVARAEAPTVMAVGLGQDTLMVGLATRHGDRYTIAAGDGRWLYSLRNESDVPFVVRIAPAVPQHPVSSGEGEAPLLELDAKPGDLLAELCVTRQRTVVGSQGGMWSNREDGVAMAVPPGFVSKLDPPTSPAIETKVLPASTILAELRMPRATLTVDDDFLVVSMTGSNWGSGHWEYPLGELQALQLVKADLPPNGPGPWDVPAGALIAELRTSRKAIFRYVDQWWTLAGRPIAQLVSADMLRRTRDDFDAAGKRLNAAKQEAGPGAAEKVSQAERACEKAWADLGRAEKGYGLAVLSGPGQVLDPARPEVVVEPGTPIARLFAETPGDRAALAGRETPPPMMTRVALRGDTLEVRFAHTLPLPVNATVEVSPGDRVAGHQPLATYFRPQRFDLKNYSEAATYVTPFLVNTVIVAVADMALSLLFASLAAFVFSRFKFPGKALFYGMIMVLMMIPGVLNLIPMYVIVKNMGLVTPVRWINLLALILPSIAGGLTVNIYIMRNNLEALAKDLFDAARIDGASNFQTYRHIALPLSKPIMGTLAIFVLLSQWNNFIWPWVVIKEWKNMPVTAGLALLQGQNLSDYGLQMAGSVLASLPLVVLFFFMMNLFIRGIQSGAIKA
jgi:ABC-type glycerol-3-phosphate transport system permease component